MPHSTASATIVVSTAVIGTPVMMTVIASPVCVAGPARSPDAGRVAEGTVLAHAPRSLIAGLRISRADAGAPPGHSLTVTFSWADPVTRPFRGY
jgi:hypothetical protein